MIRRILFLMAILALVAGCAGIFGVGKIDSKKEHDLRVGNIPSALHPEWKEADRCSKCHQVWSWKFGYYRGWDHHGLMHDYSKTSMYGYKDPYGLDATPRNSFV